MKKYRIIDFHTHPFKNAYTNICTNQGECNMSKALSKEVLTELGVEKICGSVIAPSIRKHKPFLWEYTEELNNIALELKDYYEGFYIPGFHVHPAFVKESIAEIERMNKLGVKIIGELVHYMSKWDGYNYSSKELWEILEVVDHFGMIVDFHSGDSEEGMDSMDEMVKRFPNLKIAGAHIGSDSGFNHHIKRLESSENYYVDISASGLSEYGRLRYLMDRFGKERFIYGSDFPTCNENMFVASIMFDDLFNEDEKEYVYYKNAARLLDIKD